VVRRKPLRPLLLLTLLLRLLRQLLTPLLRLLTLLLRLLALLRPRPKRRSNRCAQAHVIRTGLGLQLSWLIRPVFYCPRFDLEESR
jgi:hypothetical protein